MHLEELYQYCLSKPFVSEHFPFDQDTLVFKVHGKMFCLTSLHDWEVGKPSVNIKYPSEEIEELRANFDAVQPGYHMHKSHWNTVYFNQDATDHQIKEWIQLSYDLVWKSLPAKVRNSL